MEVSTRPDLDGLLAMYKRILHLRDWRIFVKYVRLYDLDGQSVADVKPHLAKKDCEYPNPGPARSRSAFVVAPDVEISLVHELDTHHPVVILRRFGGRRPALRRRGAGLRYPLTSHRRPAPRARRTGQGRAEAVRKLLNLREAQEAKRIAAEEIAKYAQAAKDQVRVGTLLKAMDKRDKARRRNKKK